MPRGYGYFAELLIQMFGVLLPLGLVQDLVWLTIPITVLVCLAFTLISEVGRVLEDPFTTFWPALPLSALSKTIEINLRERLGEEDLPPMPKPDERGILM
jgi:putative membrane protein